MEPSTLTPDSEGAQTPPLVRGATLQTGLVRRLLEHMRELDWRDASVRRQLYDQLKDRLDRKLADDRAEGIVSVFEDFEPIFLGLVARCEWAAGRATTFEDMELISTEGDGPGMDNENSNLQQPFNPMSPGDKPDLAKPNVEPGPRPTPRLAAGRLDGARFGTEMPGMRPASTTSKGRSESLNPVATPGATAVVDEGLPDDPRVSLDRGASPPARAVGTSEGEARGADAMGGRDGSGHSKWSLATPLREWGVALLAAAAFALALGHFLIASRDQGRVCGPDSTTCFDSGWQAANNSQTSTYFYKNALGALPRNMTVWFSPADDGADAFLVYSGFPSQQSGNPITIQAQPGVIFLQVAAGVPIHGTFNAAKNQWTTYTQGFFRVVASQ